MTQKVRVAIDCRIGDHRQGVGTAFLALAKGLSAAGATDQEYTFIVPDSMREWLLPYVGSSCAIETIPSPKPSLLRKTLRNIGPLRTLWSKLPQKVEPIATSDGFVVSGRFDLVHFPTQVAYLTNLPSIYQPWDLQHVHYPQFFSEAEYARRERNYRAFCEQATVVCVQAEWTKQDLIKQYGISADKISVIPWGPIFDVYDPPSEETRKNTLHKYGLPQDFFFYPAVTWPHKNHEIIFRALQILRDQNRLTPHAVFTGAITDHKRYLDQLAQELDVTGQIHFLGFISPSELRSISQSALAMVFPSRFEGFGLPILEAFRAQLSVLSSDATTLPEIARDGARYFDPDDPVKLALMMKEIIQEPDLRRDLIKKGTLALSRYSIEGMVRGFQDLYRRVAGR